MATQALTMMSGLAVTWMVGMRPNGRIRLWTTLMVWATWEAGSIAEGIITWLARAENGSRVKSGGVGYGRAHSPLAIPPQLGRLGEKGGAVEGSITC